MVILAAENSVFLIMEARILETIGSNDIGL